MEGMMKRGIILILSVLLICTALLAQEKTVAKLTVEAELCTSIENRMPVGAAKTFSADVGMVYLWTKVLGATDTVAVYHVWTYNGKEMARVELSIKSNAWRTWTSKNIMPYWVGDWTVRVEDAAGLVLKELTFKVQ